MTVTPVNEMLTQIERDYRDAITSVRTVMASNQYSSTDKKLIAMKITQLVDQLKNEVAPWTM